ncbi:MAG: type IV pilus secretin PilQ [Deltaproteobacteria bacterium]|nr:type IV pilus secretin PilQ [Deltaproteobacteria bacterium]
MACSQGLVNKPPEGENQQVSDKDRVLKEVNASLDGRVAVVKMEGTGLANYHVLKEDGPPRIIVDLTDVKLGPGIEPKRALSLGLLTGMSVSEAREKDRPVIKVELTVAPETEYDAYLDGQRLIVKLGKTTDLTRTSRDKTGLSGAAPATEGEAKKILSVNTRTLDNGFETTIEADGVIKNYNSFLLKKPDRLVIDLWETPFPGSPKQIDSKTDILNGIRIGQHKDKTRFVMEFKNGQVDHFISKIPNGMVITLGPAAQKLATENRMKSPVPDEATVAANKPRPEVLTPDVSPAGKPEGESVPGEAKSSALTGSSQARQLSQADFKPDASPAGESAALTKTAKSAVLPVPADVTEQTEPKGGVSPVEIAVENLPPEPGKSASAQSAARPESSQPVQAPADLNVASTPASGSKAKIKAIQFKIIPGGNSRVEVVADQPVKADVIDIGGKTVVLRIPNSELPKKLRHPVEAMPPTSVVKKITPRSSADAPGATDVTIQLRAAAPHNLVAADDVLMLDFSGSQSAASKSQPRTMAANQSETSKNSPESISAVAPAKSGSGRIGPTPGMGSSSDRQPATPELIAAIKDIEKDSDKSTGPASKTKQDEEISRGTKIYTGQKVSLDFQEADIKNIFRLLSEVSTLNIIVSDDVKGKITLRLNNVPWDQALDLILTEKNLDKLNKGNVIWIAPKKTISAERTTELEAFKKQEELKRDRRELEEVVTDYIPVNYGNVEDVAKQVKEIKSARKDATVTVDNRTSTLIITDTRAKIDQAKYLIKILDRATPQVMIEARIVEVTKEYKNTLGVQWGGSVTGGASAITAGVAGGTSPALVNLLPSTAIGAMGISFGRLLGTNLVTLDAQLQAMESLNEGKVISAPRVATLNNQKAMIKQSDSIPYRTANDQGVIVYKTFEAALQLDVTPKIAPNDSIILDVQAKTEVPFSVTNSDVPGKHTKEAKTNLMVRNGETLVIGGIIRNEDQTSQAGVPLLSRMPFLGYLFKTTSKDLTNSELMIFITPKIITMDQPG